MIRSQPTNPLIHVSVNLHLDLVLWLDGLVNASHDADDPESRSGVVRMMLRLARAELERDANDDLALLAEAVGPAQPS